MKRLLAASPFPFSPPLMFLYRSLKPTSWMSTLPTSPSPPSTKSITPAKQHFPSPTSRSPFLLQAAYSIIPPSLFSSLSPFQWMHNPPFSEACPGGWGSGDTHTFAHIRTPRCACTSADEQTPITGSDKKRDRTMKRGQAIMIRKECCFLCNMQNVTEIAVLLQLWIKQHKKKLKVHICSDVHELGASVLGIQKRNKNKHLYSYSNRKKFSGC